jgi:hypothetical protein
MLKLHILYFCFFDLANYKYTSEYSQRAYSGASEVDDHIAHG